MNSPCLLPSDRPVRIVTHSGSFHADELLAVATLQIFLDRMGLPHVVNRTRDPEIIAAAHIVCDVGGALSPHEGRFDHHQRDGGGEHNGIPYSSFGLVWKYFGLELCGGDRFAWETIEKKIAYPVDAGDNGLNTYNTILPGVQPLLFHHIVFAFHPTWKEKEAGVSTDVQFAELLPLAKRFMERELTVARDDEEGARLVRELLGNEEDKRIVVIDRDLPWEEVVAKYPEPLFVVSPRYSPDTDMMWRVEAVRSDVNTFDSRKRLPEAWCGLMGQELEAVTGVAGSVFCHKKGFLAIAKTKEAAIALARLAL
jgi:uncharacterized UPF0160 family protein